MAKPSRPPVAFAVFGATGDLTQRKLYPSIYKLAKRGLLPKDFALFGISRKELSDEEFRSNVERDIRARVSGDVDESLLAQITAHAHYIAADLNEATGYMQLEDQVRAMEKRLKRPVTRLYYLALPPSVFAPIAKNMRACGLGRGARSRVIVEKPFGYDYKTAKLLETMVSAAFDEDQIFRIDHYLGKESVQNLLTFRAQNAVFEPSWNAKHVSSIHIDALETVGLEGRGQYYDGAGSLRDMTQNHLLQLVAFMMMDMPKTMSAADIRHARAQVLKRVRPFGGKLQLTVGQYQGYHDEPDVKKGSKTDTYSLSVFEVNSPRWKGVPVYVRTGKRMQEKFTGITVTFASEGKTEPNRLFFELDPRPAITLAMNIARPGFGTDTDVSDMHYCRGEKYKEPPIGDYERLILAVIDDDRSLFVSAEEVLYSWKAVDPFIAKAARTKPVVYPQETNGPVQKAWPVRRDTCPFDAL